MTPRFRAPHGEPQKAQGVQRPMPAIAAEVTAVMQPGTRCMANRDGLIAVRRALFSSPPAVRLLYPWLLFRRFDPSGTARGVTAVSSFDDVTLM